MFKSLQAARVPTAQPVLKSDPTDTTIKPTSSLETISTPHSLGEIGGAKREMTRSKAKRGNKMTYLCEEGVIGSALLGGGGGGAVVKALPS